MAELDPDGLPVLPEGMFWRLRVTAGNVGVVAIRQKGKWWFSKKVFDHYYIILTERSSVQEVTETCFRLWQGSLAAEASVAKAKREAGDYGKR